MKKLVGLAVVAAALGAASLAAPACKSTASATPSGCGAGGGVGATCAGPADCTTDAFCDALHWVCASSQCIFVCRADTECAGTSAMAVCDDGACRPPACASDADCSGTSSACVAGNCQAPVKATDVMSCQVLPNTLLTHAAATHQMTVVAQNANGDGVPYKGAISWTSSTPGNATVDAATGLVTGGAAAGQATIGASIAGGVSCNQAVLTNFIAPAVGKLRVVVADAATQSPIGTASLVLHHGSADDAAPDTSASAQGVYTFDISGDAAGATRDLHVFEPAHTYVSMLGLTTNDIVVFLLPEIAGQQRPGFKDSLKSTDFSTLEEQGGEVHLALFGSSIPGTLLDLSLSTLLGDFIPTQITGITSMPITVPLPSGIVLGIGDNMFKGNYTAYATPGTRAEWGLGGNARFREVVKIIGPAINDPSNIDVGSLLNGLLPLLSKLQSGVLPAQKAETGVVKQTKVPLTTLLRLKVNVKLPDLPLRADPPATGQSKWVDGVIVLGGSEYESQGLVPLGLTAGLDKDDNGAVDGKVQGVDASGAPTAPGLVPMRLAPLHGGLETGGYGFVALSLAFPSIGTGTGTTTTSSSSGTSISTIVDFGHSADVKYNISTPPTIDLSQKPFLSFVSGATLVQSNRAFSLGTPPSDASFVRLEVTNGNGKEWVIYATPERATNITVPAIPSATAFAGLDPLATVQVPDPKKPGMTKNATPQVLVQSATVTPDVGDPTNHQQVLDSIATFNSHNLDDLSRQIDRFSVTSVKATATAP